ncbi:hypothetical protein [Hymenobacter sp. 102]|uniref:hypothetical protein n=1 Tax=Hymenobacter sp. 102 TaxID=3403152 RepID=UPI003CF59E32
MSRFLLLLLSFHLLAVSLLPGGDARELTEVASAWQHRTHEHASSTLLDFVYDHFVAADSHEHSGDHAADHQSLPLHHGHDTASAAVYVLPVALTWQPNPAQYAAASRLPNHAEPAARQGVLRPCWQPPRA